MNKLSLFNKYFSYFKRSNDSKNNKNKNYLYSTGFYYKKDNDDYFYKPSILSLISLLDNIQKNENDGIECNFIFYKLFEHIITHVECDNDIKIFQEKIGAIESDEKTTENNKKATFCLFGDLIIEINEKNGIISEESFESCYELLFNLLFPEMRVAKIILKSNLDDIQYNINILSEIEENYPLLYSEYEKSVNELVNGNLDAIFIQIKNRDDSHKRIQLIV